ncbi:MAG TPA: CapA family protein [Thermoleophilia bacterium]|nr:CapA family protein [Thermoleophilia bacterium]
MSGGPRRPDDLRVYRSAGRDRRRWLGGVAAVAVLASALAAGAWAWSAGGGSGDAEVGAAPAPSPSSVAAASLSPSPSPTATATPLKVIEIGWVGDTTPGSKYGLPPDGGRPLFARVRDQLRAPDLMIANLEGTYSEGGPSKCDDSDSKVCFAFQAPPSCAEALPWAGIDLVSLANNHTNDYFASGLEQTKAALERNDVEYTGLPGQVTVVRVDGVRVAALGFSPYSWNQSLLDIPAAEALVRRAAKKADVVVVLIHAGAEGADETHTPEGTEYAFGENRGDSRAFAHAAVDAGADLVLGSGPHVIRGIERYRGKLIAYSLGNFAAWRTFGTGGTLGLSGLLTVKVDENGRVRGGRWLSLRLEPHGVPEVDSSHAAARLVRRLSDEDFAKTFRMDAKGNFTVP